MYCGARFQIVILSRWSTVFVHVKVPIPGLTSKLQVHKSRYPDLHRLERNFISNIQPHILGIVFDILEQVNSATDFKKKHMLITCVVMYHQILNCNESVIYYFTNISTFCE
jgi:hypothetical protein